MAKYIFLNMPARGHVNPTLPVAQELVRRGEDVSYYLTEEYRDVVEATGAKFQPYESKVGSMPPMPPMPLNAENTPSLPPNFSGMSGPADAPDAPGAGGMPNGRTIGPAFMLADLEFVPPQIIDRIRAEKPDAIIYDFMCIWARKIIDELHIPAIATRATYASNEHFNLMEHMRKNMEKMAGMGAFIERMRAMMEQNANSSANPMSNFYQMFSHAEALNIIFMPREFQLAGETFDERYVFVGPSILPRPEAPDFPFEKLDSARPLLYISLGSVFNNQPEFYKQCFEAFGDQPWQVVLSTGKRTDLSTIGAAPENFLLAPYVPQLEILPRTRLFVTHAGTNSIMESMYFGVPMVLFPQQPEQQLHAQRVEDMGLGVALSRENLNAATLRAAVERVAGDAGYRERVQQMQQSVRASGGYARAADAIMEFTGVRAGR